MLSGGTLSPCDRRRAARRIEAKRVESHDHDEQDPARGRRHVAAHEVVDHVVGDRDHSADGALVDVEDVDEDALPAQETGQGDDERGDPEPGDDGSLEGADHGAGGHAHDERRPTTASSAATR